VTTHKPHGPIPPLPPIPATPEQIAQARTACATRARERGEDALAASFEAGGQDLGWAMRHQLKMMEVEYG
jgi:hypothetical protein